MKLHIASSYGFCFGVNRAIDLANKIEEGPRYLLGQIVHNKEVNDNLESKGFRLIDTPEDNTPGIGVIRAHGICKDVHKSFIDKGFTLLDGTCPIVKLNTSKAQKGVLPLIIVGKAQHPEIKFMVSYVQRPYVIVTNVDDILQLNKKHEYDLIVQTTFSTEQFDKIKSKLEDEKIVYYQKNDICKASIERRDAVLKLCEICDKIIIIGDKNSSNSQALKTLAESRGITSYLVSSADEITLDILECDNLGLSSGASVADSTFETIKNKILQLSPNCL